MNRIYRKGKYAYKLLDIASKVNIHYSIMFALSSNNTSI